MLWALVQTHTTYPRGMVHCIRTRKVGKSPVQSETVGHIISGAKQAANSSLDGLLAGVCPTN